MVNNTYTKEARAVLRAMVTNGEPPPADKKSEDFGEYAEAVQCLYDAHAQGGTDAVRRAFEAMARADYNLAELVAGGQGDTTKTLWTMEELLATEFPEPHWVVQGILPVGLTMFAGRPKIGKSWLGLQSAYAVANGDSFFDRGVEKGKVLYVALEDSKRRIKFRLMKQGCTDIAPITFAFDWKPLPAGGMVDLQEHIVREGYRLVIIDTLTRSIGKADQQDVGEMTAIIGNIQRLAQAYNLSIVVIDHLRKPTQFEQNPVDDILGSTAKSAVPDCIWGMFREHGRHEATLAITGRDVEEQELALEWDAQTCAWVSLGSAGEVRKNTLRAEILDAISTLTETGELATTAAIAAHLGKPKSNVSRELGELLASSKVIKGEKVGKSQLYLLNP